MTMTPLTPRQSKAAALALLVLVLALVAGIVAVPLWWLNQRYDSALEDASSRLERYSKIVGMREDLQKKSADMQALAAARHFLKGTSPALAAAELQELAKTSIESNGGKINSVQILAHKDDGSYRQISVTLQLAAPQGALKGLLYALESARPYLFIDNLSIRAPMVFVVRNTNTPSSEPDLLIQFDLTAYALKGAP